MAGDRPGLLAHKILALNVDFSSLNISLLGFLISSLYRDVKYGYPFNMRDFCLYSLI